MAADERHHEPRRDTPRAPARRARPAVLLLAGFALLVVAGLWIARAPAPSDGPPYPGIDVAHYALRLRIDPAPLRVQGEARIRVRHLGPVGTVPLLLAGLVVDSVHVDGRAVPFRRQGDRLEAPVPLDSAASTIVVAYHGRPDRGLYATERGGRQIVYTDSWPDRARGWMPSVDHPADPATLALTLDLPLGLEPVATGRAGRVDTLDGRIVADWTLDAAAPTYAFAFAAADFAFTDAPDAGGPPVRYALLAADSARAAWLDRTPDALAFFSDYVGPYPFDSYTVVQAPIRFGGMENASAPFLSASLFRDGRRIVESVQVHEAAHQWFGSRVTIRNWRDLWLSEGMATYLAARFFAHADGPEAAHARLVDLARLSARDLRTHGPLVPSGAVDPNALLSWVPYRKGASVLHLLRLRLGEDAFRTALRRTYAGHAGRPLSTDAWQDLLERAGGQDLDAFFAYWVFGDRLPTLRLAWNEASSRLRWRVEDDAGTLAGLPAELWLRQDGQDRTVPLTAGEAALPGRTRPEVLPVGVLLRTTWGDE